VLFRSVEFALIAPFLMTVVVAVVDLGTGLHHAMQVENAAQAGLQYALVRGFDAAAITARIAATSPDLGIAASPEPQRFCGCPSASAIEPATCGAFCPDGSTTGTFVSVSAAATYRPPIAFPFVPETVPLQTTTIARIQ
jgi:hypothetical protein